VLEGLVEDDVLSSILEGVVLVPDDVGVPLAGAIRALRSELQKAMMEGEGEELRFGVGPVELELQVEVSNQVGGEAGIKFWLVSIGGTANHSSAKTHTFRFTLSPVDETGKPIEVHSRVKGRPK
jgi:hypothetical protein